MEIWKLLAKNYLEKYKSLETSITFLKNRISALEQEMAGVSSPVGAEPVAGGSHSPDERYINCICQKMEYEKKLQTNISEYNAIKAVLQSLPEDEQYILQVAYINRNKYYIEKIMSKFYVEKSRAYEMKEKAMRDFVVAMFGK